MRIATEDIEWKVSDLIFQSTLSMRRATVIISDYTHLLAHFNPRSP